MEARAWLVCAAVMALALGGCTANYPAPVTERLSSGKAPKGRSKAVESDWRPKTYVVQKGDTLYSIALEHGFGYREVADWNGIEDPHRILVGQELRLTPPAGAVASPLKPEGVAETKPPALVTQPKAIKQPYSEQAVAQAEKPAKAEEKPAQKVAEKPVEKAAMPEKADVEAVAGDDEALKWVWPSNGKVIASFSEPGNKGVDIGGKLGQPVLASADGKVVYSGSGLRGYGKLIIIKHNKTYLSAYAHNSRLLVKEGQNVAKGQKIAEMGSSDADQIELHFEIRRLGKPVDPLKFLPGDKS